MISCRHLLIRTLIDKFDLNYPLKCIVLLLFQFHLEPFHLRYKAYHIILDYLQDLTLKYVHNTRKNWCFLRAKFYIKFIPFCKMIHSF